MEKKKTQKTQKNFSFDWLLKGVLTKLGDTFDRLTGRRWKPSSSLATSELIERIKLLLDAEVKDLGKEGRFVPHNIKLKMQWDKFSTDSDESIGVLENELHIAAIDHINDQRYYTYAPLQIDIKPDYFTEGVKLLASFDTFDEEEREVAVNVTVPDLRPGQLVPDPEEKPEPEKEIFIVSFEIQNKKKEIQLAFSNGERKSVGRTKENDLVLDDPSVSKIHSAFVFNSKSQLVLADTGSTNGTFINGQRIAYGRAFPVGDGDKLKFGTVEIDLTHISKEIEEPVTEVLESEQALLAANQKSLPEPAEKGLSTTEVFGTDFNSEKNREFVSNGTLKKDLSDTGESVEPTADSIENFEEVAPLLKEDEEDVNPTEPGIILDFGDKN